MLIYQNKKIMYMCRHLWKFDLKYWNRKKEYDYEYMA